MSTSSEEDDNFLRIHAKAIAEALQQQDALDQAAKSGGGPKNQTERERMIHNTYVALCYDDPQVESDLACQYLAMALLDPKSPYALSGPLVEGIRQFCANQQQQQQQGGTTPSNATTGNEANLTSNTSSSTPKGSAMLAWAIYARIPLLCCQTKNLSEIQSYLGSYRPPPPAQNPLEGEEESPETTLQKKSAMMNSPEKHMEADRLAEMLSQPPSHKEEVPNNAHGTGEEEEVWAAESDPSDFEFESGFSYEQQMDDFQNTFAAWMMDRSDPIKLSQPPPSTEGGPTINWKQVRHAVMDLSSQLNYRQVSSLWNNHNTSDSTSLTGGSNGRGPADILTQFTMTLLVPPPATTIGGNPSIFDCPDDEEDAIQPQRQLQAMAWYPLWVLRDAAAAAGATTMSSPQQQKSFSQYLTLLQTLISVDAAASSSSSPTETDPMAPATYVGLASLSALCQKFVLDTATTTSSSASNVVVVERYRNLRLALWEIADDLSHALEKEERISSGAKEKTATTTDEGNNKNSKNSDWILWTLLPLFEILTNQRLQNGTTIVAKAESMAQMHYNNQQSSKHWAGLLQSGLFRQWMLKLQALKKEPHEGGEEEEKSQQPLLLWHLMRRSLLYMIAQSMTATSALGKYAWRFPNFVSVVEIGSEAPKIISASDGTANLSSFSERLVDDVLWHLLCMELVWGAAAAPGAAPVIQWKCNAKKNKSTAIIKPLPTREESQEYCLKGFQSLCSSVVHVLNLVCQEENKKENLVTNAEATSAEMKNNNDANPNMAAGTITDKAQYKVVLQSFDRFVDSLVACPQLAKLFVQYMETTSNEAKIITKCMDIMQGALSQYKAPASDTSKSIRKAKDEDGEGKTEEVESLKTKEQVQDASLQEAIHNVRKALKVLRSLVSSKTQGTTTLDLTSSSKTD